MSKEEAVGRPTTIDHTLCAYRLETRSHSTQQFLQSNTANLLQVASFRFFQSAWDESVSDVFSKLGEVGGISMC